MPINKEQFTGISNKVKDCLDILSELPEGEKKQLAILMIAQTVSPKFAAETANFMLDLDKWENLQMSYYSFSDSLPKKLYVIRLSDPNQAPGVRTEVITAASPKRAVEIAREKWPEAEGMMVVDSRDLI